MSDISTPDVAQFWLLEHIENYDNRGSTVLGLFLNLEHAKQVAVTQYETYIRLAYRNSEWQGSENDWRFDSSDDSQFVLCPITLDNAVSSPAVSIAMAILRGESWAIDLALDVASRGG